MTEIYDREDQLRKQLNSVLESEFQLPYADYYSRLDLDGFLHLKSVLSDINNIFTLKVAIAFAKWVSNHLELDNVTQKNIISQILSTKPNANGYDIEVSGSVNIIAEVKCNIPINGGKVYGSAQKNGIAKDIGALINGKSKSQINPTKFLKFMVFLDLPEIRTATEHFVKNMKEGKELITYARNDILCRDKNRVYISYVRF